MAKKTKMSEKDQIALLNRKLEEVRRSLSSEVLSHAQTVDTAHKLSTEARSLREEVSLLKLKLKESEEEVGRLHKVAHHSLGLLHAIVDNAEA